MRLIPIDRGGVAAFLANPSVVGRKLQLLSSDHPRMKRLEVRAVVDGEVLVGRYFDRKKQCWRYTTEYLCCLITFTRSRYLLPSLVISYLFEVRSRHPNITSLTSSLLVPILRP